jgi:hypothetical protein
MLRTSYTDRPRSLDHAGSERRRRRVVPVIVCVAALLCTVHLAGWYSTLLTPVWGVVVQPEWVLVRGTRPVALVTLAIPDARHAVFREVSLREKAAYAQAHGYWFIACNVSLDTARTPVWSKLRLVAAVLEQARGNAGSPVCRALTRAQAGCSHGAVA